MFEPNTPSYRDRKDFERNAILIKELSLKGRLSINKAIRGSLGLEKVRYAPNGRLNIDTINEGVRSMMHMMNGDILTKMKNSNLKDDTEK
jgi:hypothetical protein